MKKITHLRQLPGPLSLFGLLLFVFVLLAPESAHAACGGTETSLIDCGGGSGDNGIWGLLLIALNVMTAGVGVLAVGGIVYGAILYTTAEDKADQIKKATDIITNVVIGLVAFALMWAGLNFLIPGGVFS